MALQFSFPVREVASVVGTTCSYTLLRLVSVEWCAHTTEVELKWRLYEVGPDNQKLPASYCIYVYIYIYVHSSTNFRHPVHVIFCTTTKYRGINATSSKDTRENFSVHMPAKLQALIIHCRSCFIFYRVFIFW